MAECIKCGDYTKFNGGLCIKCYSKKESNLENIDSSVVSSTTSSGLNDKDKNYR